MREALESRQGLTSYAVTSIDDLDVPALLTLLDDAWRADYPRQARPAFGEGFLRWLLREPLWVGVLLCTPAGAPVGFELAFARTLFARGHEFRAYYASLFSVSPHYRRRGLGRWLLEQLNHLVFVERRADLIFSTFHAGHAGILAVQDTYDRIPDWGVRCFHTSRTWGHRLAPFSPVSTPSPPRVRGTRVVWHPGGTVLTPISDDDTPTHAAAPSLMALNETLRTRYQAAFGLGESFRAHYLLPGASRAGTFWYGSERGPHCAVTFHITPIASSTLTGDLLGLIQTVHTSDCSPLYLQQALEDVCRFFSRHGCRGATILEQGVVPESVLYTLRFRPINDQRIFTVRGPRAALDPFSALSPPYCLDSS